MLKKRAAKGHQAQRKRPQHRKRIETQVRITFGVTFLPARNDRGLDSGVAGRACILLAPYSPVPLSPYSKARAHVQNKKENNNENKIIKLNFRKILRMSSFQLIKEG